MVGSRDIRGSASCEQQSRLGHCRCPQPRPPRLCRVTCCNIRPSLHRHQPRTVPSRRPWIGPGAPAETLRHVSIRCGRRTITDLADAQASLSHQTNPSEMTRNDNAPKEVKPLATYRCHSQPPRNGQPGHDHGRREGRKRLRSIFGVVSETLMPLGDMPIWSSFSGRCRRPAIKR